jgi:hypothetical protein
VYQHQQPENGFGATGRSASQRAWQRLHRGPKKPRAPSSIDLVMRRSKSPTTTSGEEKDSNTWWECPNVLFHFAWAWIKISIVLQCISDVHEDQGMCTCQYFNIKVIRFRKSYT